MPCVDNYKDEKQYFLFVMWDMLKKQMNVYTHVDVGANARPIQ